MTRERSPGPGLPDSLASLLTSLAAGLPDVRGVAAAGRVEWSRGGIVFAVLDGDAGELRLDPPVTAAALKTPDTSPSSRGTSWIRFAPRELDGHAHDRLAAWFGLAYRRAIGP